MEFTKKCLNDFSRTLTAPRRFFSGFDTADTAIKTSLLRTAVIYGMLLIIMILLGILGLLQTMSLVQTFFFALFILPFIVAAFLFMGGLVIMLFSWITSGLLEYAKCLSIQSYMLILWPASMLLSVVSMQSIYLSFLLNLSFFIYALVILYFGLTEGLKANPIKVKILEGALIVIFSVFVLLSLAAIKSAEKFFKERGISMEEIERMQENPEEMNKKIDDIIKEYQKQRDQNSR